MKITHQAFVLELAHTFGISRESHDFQDSLIVSISKSGKTGYGEATSNPYYGVTIKKLQTELNTHISYIEAFNKTTPEAFYQYIIKLPLSSFTICALDMAYNDLYGKIQNKSLLNIWNLNTKNYPTTNYTIGIASIEEMTAKLKEKPWPIYKIKLGTKNDLQIIKALREVSNSIFRVDANCAWSVEQTLEYAPVLKQLGVEFIEQPLPASNWKGMKTLYKKSVLPIMADESCLVNSDVKTCHKHFHGINIKLTKCGGLTPARLMIEQAKSLGLKVMIGCMTESSVGISAIAQLLPLLDYVDMDGALLLKKDIAKGVIITNSAEVIFPDKAGTGVTLNS